jgi:hypothetical protein
MDDLTQEDFKRFIEAQKEWTEAVSKLREITGAVNSSTSGNMTLNVNAGGWSVLILLAISSFVLGIAVYSAFSSGERMNSIESRQNRQDDYIQAIYAVAPQLKPKEAKQ